MSARAGKTLSDLVMLKGCSNMHVLKIKIEGPTGGGKTTLENIIRECLVALADDGRIGMIRLQKVEHEIEIEIESVKALRGK